ncbi:MAG: S41 family peptidase, partial [Treponema sp.]|nr:S41 family peptidase [Treponema sp.]
EGYMPRGLSFERDEEIAEILSRHFVPLPEGTGFRAARPGVDLFLTRAREDLAEEVLFLFDLLRYGYGAYEYFGGDEVFIPRRDAALERLGALAERVSVGRYLREILEPAFRGAIEDNHFQIHDITFGAPPSRVWMSGAYTLYKGEEGALEVAIDEDRYRLLCAELRDGTQIDGVLPTLTREGELAWAFGHFSGRPQGAEARSLTAFLQNIRTGETMSHYVGLYETGGFWPSQERLERVWDLREERGVPLLDSAWFPQGYDFDAFIETGSALRERPAAIIDLRGNGGGNGTIPDWWMLEYAGREGWHRMFAEYSMTSRAVGELFRHSGTDNDRYRSLAPPGLWPYYSATIDMLATASGEGLLLVLMDSVTASAGDYFAGLLRQLENAIVIGANTAGTLISGGIGRATLPHSGLDIIFGTGLMLRPDLSQFEGVGFLPDLWVPSEEAMERAFAFLARHGLAR